MMKRSHSRLVQFTILLLVSLMIGLSGCRPGRTLGQWKPQDSGTEASFLVINFVNGRQGWVVGWSGEKAKQTQGWIVLTTTNGGVTWQPMPGQAEQKIRSVSFTTPKIGWAITTESNISYTADGGTTWETQREAGTVQVRNELYANAVTTQPEPIDHLFFINSSTGWAWGGGQRRSDFSQPGVLLRTRDGGRIWSTLGFPFQNDLIAFQFVDPDRGYACEYQGGCYRSDDGGRSWKKVVIREGLTVNALRFVDRDNGWVTSDNGHALRTTDGGVTWQFRRTGATEDLRDVFFLTPREGWIIGNHGAVLFTSNGGDDWRPINVGIAEDLTRLQLVSPQLGWAVGNNGVILKYTEPSPTPKQE